MSFDLYSSNMYSVQCTQCTLSKLTKDTWAANPTSACSYYLLGTSVLFKIFPGSPRGLHTSIPTPATNKLHHIIAVGLFINGKLVQISITTNQQSAFHFLFPHFQDLNLKSGEVLDYEPQTLNPTFTIDILLTLIVREAAKKKS